MCKNTLIELPKCCSPLQNCAAVAKWCSQPSLIRTTFLFTGTVWAGGAILQVRFLPPRGGRTHNLWIKNTNSHTCCEAHMSMCRAEARMDFSTLRRAPRHNIWNMDERTLGKPKGSRTKESVSLAEHMFSHNALPGHIITMMNP